MKKAIGISALAAGVLVAFLALSGDSATADRRGYFKSDDRARVIAFHAPEPLTEAEARAVFDRVTVTAGRPALVVIYQGAAPAPDDQLTLAGSFASAAALVGNPPFDRWSWRLRVNPAGARTIDSQ